MEVTPTYPPRIEELLQLPFSMPLNAGRRNESLASRLAKLDCQGLFAPSIFHNHAAAEACLSGLWLRANDLDRSHAISQAISTPEGSFWHAIMHRREPDAWNSKYWWKRVGTHSVIKKIMVESPALGYQWGSPEAFVDFCERVRDSNSAEEELAIAVQTLEWNLLFAYCFRLAISA